MMLISFSASLTLNNLLLGLVGPLLFEVGIVDGMLIAKFGCALGALRVGYISTFVSLSGNRTLVCPKKVVLER
jgi:purine-cytosine permease-like protein